MENDFLSGALGRIDGPSASDDRPEPSLPVTTQARLLGLARSSVYYRAVDTSERDLALLAAIDEAHTELPFYGARRIRNELGDRASASGTGT